MIGTGTGSGAGWDAESSSVMEPRALASGAASGSVSTVYRIDAGGKVKEFDANLLGENYWNLADIVSR